MAAVTIQVLDGLERGRVLRNLPTPISIGREEDNQIRLNDERVSRFHAKIQEDGGRVILTDLDSTNGTRVNGHPVQMRVLQVGDQITIGRCLLVVGSEEEILRRFGNGVPTMTRELTTTDLEDPSGEPEVAAVDVEDDLPLFPAGPPDLPDDLKIVQRAQLSDLLAWVHEQVRQVLESGVEMPQSGTDAPPAFRVEGRSWQQLLRLEMELAVRLRQLGEPEQSHDG